MLAKLRRVWLNWRENRRQHAIDRALYKAGGGRHHGEAGAHGTTSVGSAGFGFDAGGGGGGDGGGATGG